MVQPDLVNPPARAIPPCQERSREDPNRPGVAREAPPRGGKPAGAWSRLTYRASELPFFSEIRNPSVSGGSLHFALENPMFDDGGGNGASSDSGTASGGGGPNQGGVTTYASVAQRSGGYAAPAKRKSKKRPNAKAKGIVRSSW